VQVKEVCISPEVYWRSAVYDAAWYAAGAGILACSSAKDRTAYPATTQQGAVEEQCARARNIANELENY
jgi:hypothetical protein